MHSITIKYLRCLSSVVWLIFMHSRNCQACFAGYGTLIHCDWREFLWICDEDRGVFCRVTNVCAAPPKTCSPLLWRHNERDSVSNHQRLYCLLKRLFRRRSKVASKLRVTGLCAWNSPGTGEFPAQKASNAENVSIWWRHHAFWCLVLVFASRF